MRRKFNNTEIRKASINAIYKSCYCVAIWVMFVACTNKHPTPQETVKQAISYSLSYDTVSAYPYTLSGIVFLKSDFLIMIDPMSGESMYALDTQTGELNHHARSDRLAGLKPSLLPFSFFHPHTRYFYHYVRKDGKKKLFIQNLRLQGRRVNRAQQLNENEYVLLGYFRKGLLGFYNIKTRETMFFGHYPVDIEMPFETSEIENIAQSFQGEMVYVDEYSKVIYGSHQFAYLACYRFTGSSFKLNWEHHVIPLPEISIVDGFIKTDSVSQRGGFSSVTASDDYIFACYWQRNGSDNESTNKHHILVYNMAGLHVATFDIDCPLSSISVDMKKKLIYGVSYVVDPIIVRFNFEHIIF